MLGGVARGCLPPSREGVAPPSSSHPPHSDWNQVDVGKLISDLDEDIRNSEMESSREQSPPRLQGPPRPNHVPAPRPHPAFPQDDADKGLKMKIKRTKSGRQEIVKSDLTGGLPSVKSPAFNGNFDGDGKQGPNSVVVPGGPQLAVSAAVAPPPPPLSSGSINNGPNLSVMSRPNNSSFGGPHMSAAGLGSGSGPPSSGPSSFGGSGPASSTGSGGSSGESCPPSSGESGPPSPQVKSEYTAVTDVNGTCATNKPPPFSTLSSVGLQQLTTKKLKVDVGTVTDASTLTEPEILGACEPGTAVNLDGIVWHETDTGVLVVNITWRGKTYVGTLLDCARHTNQWSAPRFTDSPEPGGKGRGKRGRTAVTPSEPEPRKNLRSSKGKGKGGKGNKNQGQQQQPSTAAQALTPGQEEEFNFPAPASPAKDPMKRKKEPEQDESKKRKRTSSDSDDSSTSAQEEVRPPPPPKREPKPVVYSYKMLECPRKDCNKQYKHDEGLKWHVSHSHPEFIAPDGTIRDSAEVEKEEQERKRKSRSKEDKEERKKKEGKQENGDRGTPAKQPKLEEKPTAVAPSIVTTTTPGTESKPKPVFNPQPVPTEPRPLQVRPPLYTPPSSNGRVPDTVDDLKQKGKASDSPRESPALGNPPPLLAVEPSLEKEKPPASSPAYSDISDDGDDSRGKDLKLPPGLSGPPTNLTTTIAPPSSSYSSSPSVTRSSPLPRTEMTTTTASIAHTPKTCSSFSLPGSGTGPQPGTPEYHKYLAANGFPPFPYPYPVGMDPNYHMQLLKTDPVYKAKWEKDRADRERAFKEQLDKDQGKFSGLSLVKEDRLQARKHDVSKPEDLRKREPSGDSRPRSRASPAVVNMISVKPEFREKEDVKREVKTEEGVKPTMETRGPPPGPQTFGYMHPSLIRPPYSIGGMPPPPFDPLLAGAGLSNLSPYGMPPVGVPSPYLNPALMSSARPTGPFSFADPLLRSPFPLGAADDIARAAAAGAAPPGLSGTKALDLLQQHASQYYANQKLAELQERALKSPISSISSSASLAACSPSLPKAITTLAGKDSPTSTSSSAKSPPPLRHVHTHTHTHIGLGYPLLSAGALPSVPTGLPPVGSLPPGSLPPPQVGVSAVPFSAASAYPGKSPT